MQGFQYSGTFFGPSNSQRQSCVLTMASIWLWNLTLHDISSKPPNFPSKTRWWLQLFFIFPPTWGRFPLWPIFFQMGWNHQLENRHRTGTNFYRDPLRWTTELRDIRIDDLKPSAMGEVAFPQRAFIQTFDEVPQDYRRLVVAPLLLVGPGSRFLVGSLEMANISG